MKPEAGTERSNRLVIADPYIEGNKGHFLELALVVGSASMMHGFDVTLLTSKDFSRSIAVPPGFDVRPTFTHKKIRKWSLGPHGYSRIARSLDGSARSGSLLSRFRQSITDRLHGVTPQKIVRDSSQELADACQDLGLSSSDHLLINTCDDFVLLIVSRAISLLKVPHRLNISFLWHNPIDTSRECEPQPGKCRQLETSQQVDYCIEQMRPHRLQFLATTEELRQQYNLQIRNGLWRAVDYPIRGDFRPIAAIPSYSETLNCNSSVSSLASSGDCQAGQHNPGLQPAPENRHPLKVVCGGAMRREKGCGVLAETVQLLWSDYLAPGRLRLGLQVPHDQAIKLLPRRSSRNSLQAGEALQVAPPKMDAEAYVNWIRGADIGLFLYDSRKYYARCSGVLIEMLACGVPVIVPAASWLSRQIADVRHQGLETIRHARQNSCVEFSGCQELGPTNRSGMSLRVQQKSTKGDVLIHTQVQRANHASYLAMEMNWRDSQENRFSRWYIQEIVQGSTNVVVKANLFDQAQGGEIEIRYWSPFKQRGLKIESVVSYQLDPECSAQSFQIGTTYARLTDLRYCFDELLENYNEARLAAIEHSFPWCQKHSGAAFVEAVLRTRDNDSQFKAA